MNTQELIMSYYHIWLWIIIMQMRGMSTIRREAMLLFLVYEENNFDRTRILLWYLSKMLQKAQPKAEIRV
jgi:hypothetical protein